MPEENHRATVALARANSYEPDAVLSAMRACLDPLGGMGAFVQPGQRVLLKPNILGAFEPERAVTTHPAVLRAAAILALEAGAKVSVGDSPGIGDPERCARKCGLMDVVEDLGLAFADFTNTCVVEEPDNVVARRLTLAQAVKDADVIISLPKLKTHSQMTFTGALKNQFGLVVGTRKAQYHYRMATREWLAALMLDINHTVKPALAIMDAIVAMEGDGPSAGDPRPMGVLAAGADLAALDVICCQLINLDPGRVPLLREAQKRRFGVTDRTAIRCLGADPSELALRDFRNVRRFYGVIEMLPLPLPLQQWIRRWWTLRPRIMADRCITCMACHQGCPVQPPAIDPRRPAREQVNDSTCIRCYCCHEFCPEKAIELRRR